MVKARVLVLPILAVTCALLVAQPEPVVISSAEKTGPIPARSLRYVAVDPDATVADVLDLRESEWTVGEGDLHLRLSRMDDALWVEIDLDLPDGEYVISDRHGLDDVTFFTVTDEGPHQIGRGGWSRPASEREFYTPFVSVTLPPGGGRLLIRTETTTTVQMVLYVFSKATFERMRFIDFVVGVGPSVALFVLGLMAGALAWRTRDIVYAWYGGFMLLMGYMICYMSGVGSLAVWNGNGFCNELGATYNAHIACFLLLHFSILYVKLKERHRILHRIRLGLLIAQGTILIALIVLPEPAKSLLTGGGLLVIPILMIGLLVAALLARVSRAGVMMAAWVTLFLASLYFILRFLRIVPSAIIMDRISIVLFMLHGMVFVVALAEKVGFVRRLITATGDAGRGGLAGQSDVEEQIVRLQRMASLGERIGVIGHELSGPIGAASAVAGTLSQTCHQVRSGAVDASDVGEKIGEACRLLQENLERVRTLTGNLRSDSSDLADEERRCFDICRLCEDLIRVKGLDLKKTRYVIELKCEGPIFLSSVPAYIAQTLHNLIENAVRHGFAGREEGTVTVTITPGPEDGVLLAVSDNGKGMSEEVLRHAFERRFSTTKGDGGSGLGMYVVRTLVERMGGTITVDSVPDEGTTVTVSIPSAKNDEAPGDST
jgi:signal transduction histidine kinase